METLLTLICLQLVVVFLVDISGGISTLKKVVSRIITAGAFEGDNYTLKPFDCSLCMTWWSCFFYLLIMGKFTIPYLAFSALLSATARGVAGAWWFIDDKFQKLIQ